MRPNVEEVKVTEEAGPIGGLRMEHPAFAQMGASRISGQTHLYGSDFNHQNFIRIRIAKSSLRRDLSRDWPHESSKPYLEVDLSEAQWATFVSSMNQGSGVQCTLRYLDGKPVPELPSPVRRVDQFKAEHHENVKEALEELDAIVEALAASSLSQKAKAEFKSRVNVVRQQIGANQTFVADQFGKYMETVVEKAKTEVNAYHTAAIQHLGLEKLKELGGGEFYDPQQVQIEGPKEAKA